MQVASYNASPVGSVHATLLKVARKVAILITLGLATAVLVVIDLPVSGASPFIVKAATIRLLAALSIAASLLMLYRRQRLTENVQQARLDVLVEESNDAIISQTLDGVVTDWNRAAERMFGYPAREAVGRPAASLIVPEDLRAEEAEFLSRVAAGALMPRFTTRRLGGQGEVLDVAMTVSPVYDNAGRIVGASKTIRDISEQRAAAVALSEARSRLTFATEAAGVGLWEWNLATRTMHCNDTMLRLFGVAREEFRGGWDAWRSLVHPEDIDEAERSIHAAIAKGEPFDVTVRIVTPHGEVRHIRSRGALSNDDQGRPVRFLGANIDITQDKAREREIERLNTTLEQQVALRTAEIIRLASINKAVLASSAHAVMATDREGIVTVFNPAAERMFGYAAVEIVGKPITIIRYDKEEMQERANALSVELGRPSEPGLGVLVAKALLGVVDCHEWTCINKDGSRRPTMLSTTAMRDDHGEVFGYLGILVDLSERVEKERKLAQRERFLEAVSDHSPAMVGYWDADLRCRFANASYRAWFGKTSADMMGIHLSDLLDELSFKRNEAQVYAALRGDLQSFRRTLTKPDGEIAHVWGYYVPEIDESGVQGFYCFISDVTELTEARMKLETLNESLRQKTMEAEAAAGAKSRFLATMSHEIRTPINGVLGMLELLSRTDMSAQQIDYVEKSCAAAKYLLHLLNGILDFSKIEAGRIKLETVDFEVEPLMRDLAASLSATFHRKPVELVYHVDETAPRRLRGDVFRIRQVLLNLVGNAIKFTEQGRVSAALRIRSRSDDAFEVEFSVEDTGIGIAASQLSVIFQDFTQGEASTTRRYGGTGLGLAISRQLVLAMGGELTVESRLGAGSRFHFTLSLSAAAPSEGARGGGGRSGPKAQLVARRLTGLRLLLVEDNELNRQIARELLSQEGALVDIAEDGGKGVTMTLGANPPYDAVLMDIQMPTVDGYEATRLIRRTAPQSAPPIIAMTAGAMASDKAECLAAGMVAHIAKPMDLDCVVETILDVCRPSARSAAALPDTAVNSQLIDIAGVLRRLGGNRELAIRMFRIFVRDIDHQASELLACLRDEDTERACALLHRLKGVTAAVGLIDLADFADRLESELMSKGALDEKWIMLETFQRLARQGARAARVRLSRLETALCLETGFDRTAGVETKRLA